MKKIKEKLKYNIETSASNSSSGATKLKDLLDVMSGKCNHDLRHKKKLKFGKIKKNLVQLSNNEYLYFIMYNCEPLFRYRF